MILTSDKFRSLVRAVISVESGFNPLALSPMGAAGLMQLMLPTAREWHACLKIKEPLDLFDSAQNLQIGSAYLKYLLDKFDTIELALAAYNWGMGHVQKLLHVYPGQTFDYYKNHIPGETVEYVERVLERCGGRRGDQRRDTFHSIEAMLDKFEELELLEKKNMIDKIKQWILGAVGKSIIRKLMVLLAGFLLGIGLDPDVVNQFTDSTTQVLIAVLLYVIAQGWSLLEKRAQKQIS